MIDPNLIAFVWTAVVSGVTGNAAYDGIKAILGKGFDRLASYAKEKKKDEFKIALLSIFETNQKIEQQLSLLISQLQENPATEIKVNNKGIGSIIQNTGHGIGLDIIHTEKGPAERITVEGEGIGEIITNTGAGIGKRITKTGEGPAAESRVIVNKPVPMAIGMSATVVLVTCSKCGNNFSAQKVIQGFAGDSEPKVKVNCPNCHAPIWI